MTAETNAQATSTDYAQGGVMVCVTGQKSCERLIEHGAEHKMEQQKLYVVHCVETGQKFLNSDFEPDAIEFLFTASLLANAELTVLRQDNVVDALVQFAKENNITTIIIGESRGTEKRTFADKLGTRLPNIDIIVVESPMPWGGR